MELLILNTFFEALDTIDTFESLIWTDRYNGYGDFELCTPVDSGIFQKLAIDNYLWLAESNKVMIVENLQVDADAENGNRLIITGRSLESILDRRIVWSQTILQGNLQTAVQKLLNDSIISPTIPERQISNFIFETSTDPSITSLTIDAQFTGDNLYDVIYAICEAYGLGFSIELTDDNKFKFKLYSGVDRSHAQFVNPYVEFSPSFNNLLNSSYIQSKKTLKTLTLVGGEGEGVDRIMVAVDTHSEVALNRREMFTDARDVSSTTDTTMTPEEYLDLLIQRGLSKLAENVVVQSFEGQMENLNSYKYGEDFYLGDILQMLNEYGIEARVRITELIRSQSTSGIDIYPTFSTV